MIQFLNFLAFSFIILIISTPAFAEINRDVPYAEFLFKNGYYAEARSEFLFQMYKAEKPLEKDIYQYKASKALLESGNFISSEKEMFNLLAKSTTDAAVKKAARFDYLRAAYFEKNYFKVDYISSSSDGREPREIMVLLWSYIASGNWEGAEKSVNKLSSSTNSFSKEEADSYRNAAALVAQRPNFAIKSPVLAASLSALLPGAGNLYSGSFINAFGSFFLNSVFIALTAYSYHLKNYPAFAVCGFLEIGWYIGNVVSAYQDASLVNAAIERRYKKVLLDNFPYALGYSYAF